MASDFGQRPGRLTVEQAAKLEKLGIRWNHRLEAAWEKGFASAQKYRTEHGDLLVPVRYRDKNDFALGEWIVYNRQRYLGGNLTQNRIERLEAIGMVWSTSNDLWEQNYAAATQYYLEHGDLEVPIKYETPSGFGLGVWLGAQRAAHKAGELPQEQVERLSSAMMDAKKNVRYCKECFTLTDQELCPICSSDKRDHQTIMVVENTRDLAAYEKTGKYNGVYHVLHGAISPMLGIGPGEIRLKELMQRLQGDVKEVIIATNSSLEGETTAMYISKLIKPTGIKVSRIASGVPVGGDLEYIDEVTLLRALEGRTTL